MEQQATAKPFDDCYWVIPGRLLAGEYPGTQTPWQSPVKLARLLDAGITYFLDLTSKKDPLKSYAKPLQTLAARRGISVIHSRRPISDMSCPSTEQMREILDEIDNALAVAHNVYVHCWGGVGRTGTVVGCYLVRGGATGDEALQRVAELFSTMSRVKRHFNPQSPQTQAQMEFVRGWNR